MGVFNEMFNNWIQVVDDKNSLTIENYSYNTGVIEGTTDNHCVKCVAVNQCWFKNETNKKPEKFELTYKSIFDGMSKGKMPGLYHYNCHCKETMITVISIDKISLIIPEKKLDYLFNKKGDWAESMGYHKNDYDSFVKELLQKTKEAYFYGNYYIINHTNYGCKINLNIDIPGVNEKLGQIYKIKTNYMIFPNGKLKMNTPLGGWQK